LRAMLRRLLPLLVLAVFAGTAAHADAAVVLRAAYPNPGTWMFEGPTDEWVRVRNTEASKRWIGGWTLTSHAGLRYTFPGRYLCAGCAVTVNTGRGRGSLADLFWGRTTPVWGNSSDQATLRTKTGVVADRCGWGTYGPTGGAPHRPGSPWLC
jgi:hypothetical protein